MTTPTMYDPPQDARHVPLTDGQHLVQDTAAALNADLPSAHDPTTRTEPKGRAA